MAFSDEGRQGNSWRWNGQWWLQGQLPAPSNHRLKTSWINFKNGDNEIPALTAHPDDDKKYPAVLFQHGSRGLDTLLVRKDTSSRKACLCSQGHGGYYTLKVVVTKQRQGKGVLCRLLSAHAGPQ